MELEKGEVQSILREAGISRTVAYKRFQLADSDWATVSERFCLENWTHWMASLPPELRDVRTFGNKVSIEIPRWVENSFDCDNHSIGSYYFSQLHNARESVKPGGLKVGLLYGILFYEAIAKRGNPRVGGHSINWFINQRRRLRFFEPAEGRVIELQPEEIASVWFGFAG